MPARALALSALLAMSLFASPPPTAAAEAGWIRYPAISPDGSAVVFASHDDLWLVPSSGGEAWRLTSHEAHESSPVWSPDGSSIAFVSDRHGNDDVFVMDAAGGTATRLTWHSGRDRPSAFTPDGGAVLFSASRLDAPAARLPSTRLGELYSVPVGGGRPTQVLTTPAEGAAPSPDGRYLVYEDDEARENEWRKGQASAATKDIWLFDRETGEHRRLAPHRGHDRNPVWTEGGRSLHFLSERGGEFNVWRLQLEPGRLEQVSRHELHPARFLSAALDGTLAWSHHGRLWVKRPGREPEPVSVRLRSDERRNPVERSVEREGATEFAVSPKEKEIAFVLRGDVHVTSIEHGTTRRLTDTVEQERSLTWAPDGRSLVYASERGGAWRLYRTSLVDEQECCFFVATELEEELVHEEEGREVFQPRLSPDGRRLAFLRDRDEIVVKNLTRGTTRTVVPAERNYSYADGDIRYSWSPDSEWLAFSYLPTKRWIDNIGVARVDGGEPLNVTKSGYWEGDPRWSADGRAITFASNREGRRAHGSWGSEDDVFVLYLTPEAWDRANLSVEELELLEGDEEEDGDEDGRSRGKGGERPDEDDEPPPEVRLEPEGLERRLKRATLHSAPISSHALSPDGETLVYFAQVDDDWDLWLAGLRDRKSQPLLELGDDGPGEVVFAEDGRSVFVLRSGGKLAKVELGDLRKLGDERKGEGRSEGIGYSAERIVDAPAERAHLFEHVWRQVREKFYVKDLHGVDWELMKREYEPKLAHVSNDRDFAELLSELLGELNASHTGCYARSPGGDHTDRTAALGLLFDPAHRGEGLLVGDVIAGGPFDRADSRVRAGVLLTELDGQALAPEVPLARLLNRREGQRLRLAFREGSRRWEEVVKPISLGAQDELLYQRWLDWCREETERLSGGRVGYVHVRGMNDSSFRHVYEEVLGRNADKEALLVDTRWNGGGWLHDDLVTFLQGTDYIEFVPRGKHLGTEPFDRWTRPVAVLQGEANYSDAHVFPFAFQHLGLGQLVGAPVAGTGTAVWWESLMDPDLVFGIPQVGMRVVPDGGFLENRELEPDVLVLQDPASRAAGRDTQLEAGVRVLLEELGARR